MADLNQVVAFITGQAAFIPLHPLTAQNIFRKIRIGKGLAAEARNVKPSLLDAAGATLAPNCSSQVRPVHIKIPPGV